MLIVIAILVDPPVTAILEELRDWTGLLGATVSNLNVAATTLPPIVLALATGYLVVKFGLFIKDWGHRISNEH